MKIETQPLENHQLKVIVEAEPEEFANSQQQAIRNLAKRVKIPGFRPGKAPAQIALKHLDPSLVIEETFDVFIDRYYPQILEEAHIEPYGPGTLENITSIEPPVMEFVVPLKPKVELGDYSSIRVPYEYEGLTQSEIDESVLNLRRQYATLSPVDRPAQYDDIVFLDVVGYLENEDGDQSVVTNIAQYPIIIHSGDQQENDWPFPGFSEHLIGKNNQDHFEIVYEYPDDYQTESIRGKQVRFEVTVKEIKERLLPELNDEFAKSVGNYENLEELLNDIRESLEKEKQETYHETYDDLVLDRVIEISTIHFPKQMVEKEKENVRMELENRLSRLKMDIDLYLKTRGITREELDAELEETAEHRIKRTLVMFEVADREKIQIDPTKLKEDTQQAVDAIVRKLSPKKRTKSLEKELASNIVENVMMNMLMENTLSRLRQIAKGEFTGNQPDETEKAESSLNSDPLTETPTETINP